jgi:hypothetical protein
MHSPAIPTNPKINRDNGELSPPKKSATRLYFKKPTRPQFNAPIITSNVTKKRKSFIKILLWISTLIISALYIFWTKMPREEKFIVPDELRKCTKSR